MSAFRTMTSIGSADVVVVGGGTVGAWTAVLLAENIAPDAPLHDRLHKRYRDAADIITTIRGLGYQLDDPQG